MFIESLFICHGCRKRIPAEDPKSAVVATTTENGIHQCRKFCSSKCAMEWYSSWSGDKD